jgi:6-pyruvoyl-tetrahydropterin synthase
MNKILITERRQFVADHYHSMPDFFEPRHGHNWKLEATVYGGDALRLNEVLDAWVSNIDYSLLNEQAEILGRNPTAETLAEILFDFLKKSGFKPFQTRISEKYHYWAACLLTSKKVC